MNVSERILGRESTLATWAWLCVAVGLLLSLAGVYFIDVASQVTAPHSASELAPRAEKHLIFACVGVLAAAGIALPDYRRYRLLAWPALGLCLLLLIFLLLPFVPAWIVTPRNGVRAWINLSFFDLQPSELTKIAFVLCAAEYLRLSRHHRRLTGLLPPAIIAAIPTLLILLQPDLGMAMLFIPVLFAMLVAAGAKLRHLVGVCLIAALAAPVAWPLLKNYHRERIMDVYAEFMGTPRLQTSTASQPQTARMLIGAGEIRGYSDAKARAVVKYSRLPERHNDMIFAVVVARFGLVGGLILLALYGVWMLGAVLTAAFSRDGFGRLICVGLAAFTFCQVMINVGMVVGVVPVIGLTLPFVSYGGSSMISIWLMTGLIFSVGVRKPARFSSPAFAFEE